MSKLKTKSSAKKRFSLTARGKIKRFRAGKRHNMIKRTPRQIRQKRGTTIMNAANVSVVRRFLPYS